MPPREGGGARLREDSRGRVCTCVGKEGTVGVSAVRGRLCVHMPRMGNGRGAGKDG